jgi:serine/threonine protein kinase
MIGKELGRYLITEAMGEGGMATVYKAYDKRLDREVAIKVILPGFSHSEEFLTRFEREAKVVAQLTHPNIVGVIDYGTDKDTPYIVMEYVSGGSLKDLLGKSIPWQEAAKRLAPVANALEYAHNEDIIHRDIKPANILVTKSGDFMLSDFGIAKTLGADELTKLTRTGVGIGTPAYMAPEQGMGKEIDRRVDIYSLGIVFYEMVTGRTPYQADTPIAVMMKHINEPLPRPREFTANLPEQVERILFKALSKDPQTRYQSMSEFAQALDTLRQIDPDDTKKEGYKAPIPAVIARPAPPSTIPVEAPAPRIEAPPPRLETPLPIVESKPKTLRDRIGSLGTVAIIILTLACCAGILGGGGFLYNQFVPKASEHPDPLKTTEVAVVIPDDQDTITPSPESPIEPTTDIPIQITETPSITLPPTQTNSPSPTSTPLPRYDLAFASDRDGEFAIYLMDSSTGDYKILDRPSGYERAWWPSFCGDFIAAEVYDINKELDQSIYFLNPEGGATKLSTPGGVERIGVPRCNPDASYLAYSADVGDVWALFIHQFSAQKTYQVYPEDGFVSGYASWNAQGNSFIFQVITAEDYVNLIYQMTNIPAQYQKVSSGGNPALSPNGSQMTYSCETRGDDRVLCVASPSGANERTLVLIKRKSIPNVGGIQPASAWSADGQWIYFASAEDGDWDIYRIRPDGSGMENLTNDWDSNEIYPAIKW